MATLKLALLGRPQIFLGDEPLSHLKSQKAQALIFYLAVTGQEHSREVLAGLLWPDKTEARARNNLRVEVTRLRSHLAEHLDIQRRSLRMRLDSALVCDVRDFLAVVESVQPTLRELQTAVTLYRSNFLEDFNLNDADLFTEWAQERRAYLHDRVLDALYQITEYHSQEKQYREGIDAARRLLTLEPWLERAQRQLMWLLAKSGDRAAALAQYESCCELLDEELGVAPEVDTIELYEQIKSGEVGPDQDYTQTGTLIAPPFQVPKLTENFVGRKEARVWLQQKLLAATKPVTIVGMGGLGKTTLAISTCHDLQDDLIHGVLWANVATTDPAAILEDWAQAFGYDFSRLPDVESRAAAFRGVVADKHVLLVLDNVVSLARMRPLLPTSSIPKVLLTTRDVQLAYQLSNQVLELDELSPVQANNLLSQIVGSERIQAEAAVAHEICDLLQNLPLAVELVAQRLRLFRSMRLVEMATRLRNERQRLSELEDEDQEVRASFTLSYRALDSYEKRAFMLVGVFNGRSFTREAFAAVAEWGYFTAGDRLFSLEGASLVRMREDGRFQQHSLLADFARELLADREGDEGGYGRFVHHYLHFAQENEHNYDALRPEWDNMMAAMETAHDHHLWLPVVDFADALQDAWFVRGRFSLARQAFVWTHEAAVQLKDNQKLADTWLHWGYACVEQGNLDEAKGLFNHALVTYKQLKIQIGVANVYSNLARIAVDQSQYDEATQLLDKSLKIREVLNDTGGMAKDIERQARILHRQWKYKEAHQLIHEALSMQQVLGNKLGTVQAIRLLIDIELALHQRQHRPLGSLEAYCYQVLELCCELQDQGELAATLYSLSRVKLAQDNFEEANNSALESLSLLEHIGDRRSQAIVLGYIAIVKYQEGNYEAAIEAGRKSLPLLQNLGDKTEIAITHHNLGWWHHCIHQNEQAATDWKKALEIASEIEHKALVEKINRTIMKFLVQ